MDKVPVVAESVLKPLGYIRFHAVHRHWRHKLAIRKMWYPVFVSGDTCKSFHIVVPRSQILVSDRPVHCDSLFQVSFKIEVRQAVTLSPPQQGPSPYLISPKPRKWLFFDIWRIGLVSPPVNIKRV